MEECRKNNGNEQAEEIKSQEVIVPPQYKGMHPDAVEIAWTVPTYTDPNKTEAELARKEEVLNYLRIKENEVPTNQANRETEALSSESASETTEQLEHLLEQPNVQAAQKKLEEILNEDISLNAESVKDILYKLLTKRSWLFSELERRGSEDLSWMAEEYKPHREWYRDTLEHMESQFTQTGVETASNPGWFSVTASERGPEQSDHMRYKVYDTLALNDYSKITELPKLVKKLQAIGEETQESIKIKIPGNFSGFITHNDSIVIHCDSAETCQKTQQAIAEWKTEQEVAPAERELGRATIALDGKTEASSSENESFSQLVASQISAWLEEHKDNYPAEVLASEAIKHTISLAQRTPSPSQ